VTMVLAVEAGHRMYKKGVVIWMAATIVGGLIFLGSQAFEWAEFIEGTDFGKVVLADGSVATVKGELGEFKNFTVIEQGINYEAGEKITNEKIEEGELLEAFKDGAAHNRLSGTPEDLMITLPGGAVASINKEADKDVELFVQIPGSKHAESQYDDESTRIYED